MKTQIIDPNSPNVENPNPLGRALAIFSPDQLEQIFAWLNHHTYDRTSKLIAEHFGQQIKTGALFRFYQQAAPAQLLDKTPHTPTATSELVQFAATGVPNFSQSTIALLEASAFHLALTSRDNFRALQKLNRIMRITCRVRNTATSERLAAVQQRRFDLRADELAYKKQSSALRLALRERAQNLKAACRNPVPLVTNPSALSASSTNSA
ncbi:MAG TPA: hypothetical protein VF773_18510 [Verrucomicrobiae bacterium]